MDSRKKRQMLGILKGFVGMLVGMLAGIRHDALLSIRRGFKISELRSLLRQLDSVTVSVEPARWFRIAAIIRFKPEENS